MEDKNRIEGDVKISSPIMKKLENFWYHYKIHTIAALFAVVVLTILLVQTCSRVSYDAHILYAGGYEIKHTASGGDLAPYVKMTSALKSVCDDINDDGAVNVSLLNLFVVNDAEAQEMIKDNPSLEINSTLVGQDSERLGQNLLYGDYYVCFLSERIFREYDEMYEGALFAPLAKYIPEGVECEMVNERGVYLSSLAIYSQPEISKLPPDTVVCLRSLSDFSSSVGKAKNQASFTRGEKIIINIFAYGKGK